MTAVLTAGPATRVDVALPEDAEGLVSIVDGERVGIALAPAAADAGVRIASEVGEGDAALLGGVTLPATDKFAQLTRALWSRVVLAWGWGFVLWGAAMYLWSGALYLIQVRMVVRAMPPHAPPRPAERTRG